MGFKIEVTLLMPTASDMRKQFGLWILKSGEVLLKHQHVWPDFRSAEERSSLSVALT